MKITLILDNLAQDNLRAEHGLSILAESESGAVLFDTGQTTACVENLTALGKDISSIQAVVLSHGHYDHTGGLRKAMSLAFDAKCYAHPRCFEGKYTKTEQGIRYIGIPENSTIADRVIRYNTFPTEIMPGVSLSGEIMLNGSQLSPRFFVEAGDEFEQDTFEDEQCMVLKGELGTAALLGCAHRGVENNVLTAMEVAGTQEIEMIIGGFHLGEADKGRLDEVADFFENYQIPKIVCCHCTGAAAYEYLKKRLADRVILGSAGMSWEI